MTKQGIRNVLRWSALIAATVCASACLNPQQGVNERESESTIADRAGRVDLSRLAIGASQTLAFELDGGGGCECRLASAGSKGAGSLTTTACAPTGGASAAECATLDDRYTFLASGGTVRVCDGGGTCLDY